MTMEAPDFFNVQAAVDAKQVHETGAAAIARLQEKARAGQIRAGEDLNPDRLRMFVSPVHPNEKFLVTVGAVEYAAVQNSQLGMKPAIDRHGDVWAEFSNGVCATNDQDVIDWLEAHSGDADEHANYHIGKNENPRECSAPIGLCRESGPGVDDWYKMKLAQVPLASRPVGLDPEIDVDLYVRAVTAKKNTTSDSRASDAISRVIEANTNAADERAKGKKSALRTE